MIKCTSENILYKKRKNKSIGKIFKILLLLIIFSFIFVYYNLVISKSIIKYCSEYAYSYSAGAINSAVNETLCENELFYSDLITIEKDKEGNISLIYCDTYKTNLLAREIVEKAKEKLSIKLKNGVPIPFFAFLGIDILSGNGIKIDFKSLNVNSVNCSFESEFKSVGINQTLHRIFVNINCSVSIVLPLLKEKCECASQVLICESVLVGRVPDAYLNGKLFE